MTNEDFFILKIPKSVLPKTFTTEKEKFNLLFSGSELLILKRKLKGKKEEPTIMTLWGELKHFPLPELLDLLHLKMKTGILNFDFSDQLQKTLYFRNGEVIFAQSTSKEDRLGEFLMKTGRITKEQFIEASKLVTPENHFGKILIEKGFIKSNELFPSVKSQLNFIILSIFQHHHGKFYFLEGDDILDGISSTNLDIESLIIKGIKTTNSFVEVTNENNPGFISLQLLDYNPGEVKLNKDESKLMAYIEEEGGETSLLSILRHFPYRDVTIYITLFNLAEKKIILIQKALSKTILEVEDELMDLIEKRLYMFNSFLQQLNTILMTVEQNTRFQKHVNSSLKENSSSINIIFNNVQMYGDGTLNLGKIMENIFTFSQNDRKEVVDNAIENFVNFLKEWIEKNTDKLVLEKIYQLIEKLNNVKK